MAETQARNAAARVRDHLPRQARPDRRATWTASRSASAAIVTREGGKVLKFTIWGKKKTLYPVAKQPRAIYVHVNYLGNPGVVAEVERNLRNLDEVTQYLSVQDRRRHRPRDPSGAEDVKMAGDVDERARGAPEREGRGFDGGAGP